MSRANYFTSRGIYTETLDFELEKKKVWVMGNNGFIEDQTKVAMVNNSNDKIVSYMSPSYRLFTNEEFMRLSEKIGSEMGLSHNHYASYKDGAKVLSVFDKTDKIYKVLGHEFSNHIVLFDSRDGSSKLSIGGSGVLNRCDNMFKSTEVQFSVNHSSKLDEMLGEFESGLKRFDKAQKRHIERLERLSDIKIDRKDVFNLIAKWTELSPDDVKKVANGMHVGQLSARKKNIITGLTKSWNIESSDLGNNGFALQNMTTHYYTHNRKKDLTDLFFKDFGKKEKETIIYAEGLA